jgi:hypothetical protein
MHVNGDNGHYLLCHGSTLPRPIIFDNILVRSVLCYPMDMGRGGSVVTNDAHDIICVKRRRAKGNVSLGFPLEAYTNSERRNLSGAPPTDL